MGNSNATGSLSAVYANFDSTFVPRMVKASPEDVKALGLSDSVHGGSESMTGGSCIGGYDALQDYGNSLYSRAKEQLIRNIASEVFNALKLSGAKNAKTAPISDVVKHLMQIAPKAGKGAKFTAAFNASSGKQKHVCNVLANAINSNYGGNIINLAASDNEMCNQVAEVMHSLFTGLHTEFINVAGDVMRVMRNMQTVNEALQAAYKKQTELIASTGDERLKNQSDNTNQLYNEIKAEYDRQAAVLANMMNVAIGPTGKSLVSSLEENRDFAGLIKNLKAEAGTTAFGDKLGHLLSGVSTVAHSAELIDKALKKLGMSVNEFKSAKSAAELRSRVYNHIIKDSPNTQELDKMMAAAQIIYANNYDHDAISKLLKGSDGKKGRGESFGGDADGGDDVDSVSGGIDGGADDDDVLAPYWAKKSLSKKIKNKKEYRDLVFKDFKKTLMANYQRIVVAANNITNKIGNEIPISDDLDSFIKAFGQLKTLDQDKLHIALSGYAKDSVSRERREKFMDNYALVSSTITPLIKGPAGASFKEIQTVINQMIKTIDDFSDKMVKAITEIHVDQPSDIQAALKKTASQVYGSGDSGDDSFGSGSWVAFSKVQAEMKYYYSIANIKTNMARMANEISDYGEGYEQLLGEEAGWLINQIKQEHKDVVENMDPSKVAPDAKIAGGRALKIHTALKASSATDAAQKENYEKLSKIMTEQTNAKINMIKVAQAVDLYLKAFTNGMAKDPDSVGSVVKMLEQVEVVAKWFNDRSGDNLAYLFECFPSANSGNARTYSSVLPTNAKQVVLPDGKQHYYHWLENTSTTLPGNPFLGRPLEETTKEGLDAMLNLSEKVIKSMRALENILSAFSSVGAKFGDINPSAQTFMTPGQIFNHLTAYIKASAFTTQFAPEVKTGAGAVNDITAAVYLGKIVEEKVTNSSDSTAKSIPSSNVQTNCRPAVGMNNLRSADQISRLQAMAAANKLASDANKAGSGNVHGILTGVSKDGSDAATQNLKYTSIALAAIPSEGEYSEDNFGTNMGSGVKTSSWTYHDYSQRKVDRLDRAGWLDSFYDTDMLFEMVIKSIVCKVFTVVDAYRLFHRPTSDRYSKHTSLNPLRTVMGGADGGATLSHVKVIPEALELYFRLPLLAEWYRELFSIKNPAQSTDKDFVPPLNSAGLAPGDEWRLSIVPSIDGLWSGFVNVMFDKADYVQEGNYTESQVQALIEEMNKIFKVYKSKYPKATVRNIINAFILEMNRLFGFLKRSEIKAWQEDRRSFLKQDTQGTAEEDFLDFDILNANDQFGDRPAPSDRFVNVGLGSNVAGKTKVRMYMQQYIEELRRNMDFQFLQYAKDAGSYSFVETLKNYKNELSAARSDEDEYKLVLGMMQGANRRVEANVDKLIMLHESVAAPLAVLYSVYKVIAKYNALIHGTSLAALEDWSNRRANGNNNSVKAALNTPADLKSAFKAYLAEVYPNKLDDVQLDLFAEVLATADAGVNRYAKNSLANSVVNPNAANIARDLMSAIIDLAATDNTLISCNVGTTGNVNIDFSKLQNLCLSLLEQIKSNIKKMRVSFSSNTEHVDKYESSDLVGSTRWIEEQLVQILFNNRDGTGLEPGHVNHLHKTLELLGKQAAAAPAVGAAANPNALTVDSVAGAFRELVYYGNGPNQLGDKCTINNPTAFPFTIMNLITPPETTDEKKTFAVLSAGGVISAGLTGATVAGNSNFLKVPVIAFEDKDEINKFNLASTNAKSLLVALNKIVHMYLYTNVDDGVNKFYTPLIETFVNTAASPEVLQNKAFPNVTKFNSDIAVGLNATTGVLNGPPVGTVLFASNAYAMKSLLQTTQMLGNVQKKRYAYESLADVPEYIKDRMRTNLPYFSKMLQNFYNRAELIKKFLNYTPLRNNIQESANNGNTAAVAAVESLSASLTDVSGHDSVKNLVYLNGLIDRMLDCSASLKKCGDAVYKELNDKVPYFLETSKDFIADYKQRVGRLPFMPASSLLAALKVLSDTKVGCDVRDTSHVMIPVRENGSPAYKFNFGAKAVLARNDVDPQLEHFPGAKEVYNGYASKEGSNSVISSGEYANTVKMMVRLTRFLVDGASYGRLYNKHEAGVNHVFNSVHWTDSVNGRNIHTVNASQSLPSNVVPSTEVKNNLSVFSLSNDLNTVLDVTENTGLDASKEKFAQSLGVKTGEMKGSERKKLRVYNILDMDVVPINVHAFMREVPFVNLLNYSYTFDRMVHDFVLPNYISGLGANLSRDNIMIKANSDVNSTRELMVKLLCHPWADITVANNNNDTNGKQYFALLSSLFNGNDNMKLGRPRYLSDQMWHKALLTSSAQLVAGQQVFSDPSNKFDADMKSLEAGPTAYEAVRAVVRYAAAPLNAGSTDSIHKRFKADDGALRLQNAAKGMIKQELSNHLELLDEALGYRVGITKSPKECLDLCEVNLATTLLKVYTTLTAAAGSNPTAQGAAKALMPNPLDATITTNLARVNAVLPNLAAALTALVNAPFNGNPNITANIAGAHAAIGAAAGGLNIGAVPSFQDLQNRTTGALGRKYKGDAANVYAVLLNNAAADLAVFTADPNIAAVVARLAGSTAAAIYNDVVTAVGITYKLLVAKQLIASANLGETGSLLEAIVGNVIVNNITPSAAVAAIIANQNLRAKTGFVSVVGLALSEVLRATDDIATLVNNSAISAGASGGLNMLLAVYDNILYTNKGAVANGSVVGKNNITLVIPSSPVSTMGLKYWDKDKKTWSVSAGGKNMPIEDVLYCAELGKARFDTKLSRNLTWLVQLQRIMRVVLIDHLSWLNTPVVRGLKIADPKVTEYDGNDQFDNKDFTGENYSLL